MVRGEERLHLALVDANLHLANHGNVVRTPVYPHELDEVGLYVSGLLKRVSTAHQAVADIPLYDVQLESLSRERAYEREREKRRRRGR